MIRCPRWYTTLGYLLPTQHSPLLFDRQWSASVALEDEGLVFVIGGSSTTVHGVANHTATVLRFRLQHGSLFELALHATLSLPMDELKDFLPPSLIDTVTTYHAARRRLLQASASRMSKPGPLP